MGDRIETQPVSSAVEATVRKLLSDEIPPEATCMQLFLRWIEWLKLVKCRSEGTCEAYYWIVHQFLDFHKFWEHSPRKVRPLEVSEWLNAPTVGFRNLPIKLSTRIKRKAALSQWFDWLRDSGVVERNPVRLVYVNRKALSHEQIEPKVREPYTKDELKRIEEYLKTYKEPHWLWMFYTALDTGLRLMDIATIRWTNIINDQFIVVWSGKTARRTLHKITDRMKQAMPPRDPETAMMWPELEAMSRTAIITRWKKLTTAAGVENKSFHSLRHNHAQELMKRGIPLDAIAISMGHAAPGMTGNYVH